MENEELATADFEARILARINRALHECPPMQKTWYDPAEAAAYLGFTVRGLENMRTMRRGPRFYRIGGRGVRYRVADLDAWVESGPSK